MTKSFLALALLALFPTLVPAQAVGPDAAKSDAVMKKVGQLDVLIQIVPLALGKDQIPPLLNAIEKVRQKQKELYALESKDLATLDAKLTKTVDDSVQKNVYPTHETQNEVANLLRAMGVRRSVFNDEMVETVFAVCKKTLNEGQLKTMEKSLKPELLDPSLKGVAMDSDARVKFFVRKVVLDPLTYDLLVQMSRRKADDLGPPTPLR